MLITINVVANTCLKKTKISAKLNTHHRLPHAINNSVLLQAKHSNRVIPHREFLDLTGDSHREIRHEHDVVRDFEVRYLQMLAYVVSIEIVP